MKELLPFLPEISLTLLALFFSVVLYRWQKQNDDFDLRHVLIGPDGKVSLFKIGQATALSVSSWAFIIMVQQDKLTEYYFLGYMTIWSGINLAKNIFVKAPDGSTSKT